jgi:hypothetical protein
VEVEVCMHLETASGQAHVDPTTGVIGVWSEILDPRQFRKELADGRRVHVSQGGSCPRRKTIRVFHRPLEHLLRMVVAKPLLDVAIAELIGYLLRDPGREEVRQDNVGERLTATVPIV